MGERNQIGLSVDARPQAGPPAPSAQESIPRLSRMRGKQKTAVTLANDPPHVIFPAFLVSRPHLSSKTVCEADVKSSRIKKVVFRGWISKAV